jgi:hypothetical protein
MFRVIFREGVSGSDGFELQSLFEALYQEGGVVDE